MHTAPTPRRPAPAPTEDEIPTHDARALIANGVQARVILDQQIYTLRITRAGKLILTK